MSHIAIAERIVTLAEAGEHSDCYEAAKDGVGFQLTAAAKEQIAAANDDLAERDAAHAEEMEKMDTSLARSRKALEKALIAREINEALDDAGVDPKLKRAAAAGIEVDLDIKIEERDGEHRLSVSTAYGVVSVQQAVGAWLSGEAGEGFVKSIGPGKGEDPGPLVRQIRHLAGAESIH